MAEVPASTGAGLKSLDVCTVCQFVWFDRNEYAALPGIQKQPAWGENLPQEARERLALLEVEAIREKARDSSIEECLPDAWWQWIPGVLGMPVVEDDEDIRSLPWVTWGLAVFITVVSVAAFFDLQTATKTFGLVPSQFARYGGLTFLSSFLLHGGVFHLLSNVYFLLVFGGNVEDWLGRKRYFMLLLCATLAGGVAHILGNPGATTPCVGASGGISGVVTFYALKFPRVRLGIMIRGYFMFRWFHMPAYAMFLIWLELEFLGVWLQRSGFSNVSSLAHLGGAGVGLIFWFLTRKE